MKKLERITRKIEADKSLTKRIEKLNYYSVERFIKDAEDYIKAIKGGRMLVNIDNVSASGMSRDIKFTSCERNSRKVSEGKTHYFRNYNALFDALGFAKSRKNDFYFKIQGCGMDMIFHTNYTNIHTFERLGFISKKQCGRLSQETPSVI